MKGVILAAGLGTRLRPLTFLVPKPLVTIGTTPIIDLVVRWLKANKVEELIVVGGYLYDVLERYVREAYGGDVVLVKSPRLLGTAGQLYYVRDYVGDDDVVVVNCDVLTNLDLSHPYRFHLEKGSDMTIVGYRRVVELRFGVLEYDGSGRLLNWLEKPRSELTVASGVYILRGEVLGGLREEALDMNQLAGRLPRVYVYVAKEAKFLDVGTLEDLERAQELVEELGELKP